MARISGSSGDAYISDWQRPAKTCSASTPESPALLDSSSQKKRLPCPATSDEVFANDLYYSLLQFDLSVLPTNAGSAVLYLYCSATYGGGTPLYLDRLTGP